VPHETAKMAEKHTTNGNNGNLMKILLDEIGKQLP
jgi:hypothetical protein